MLRAVLLVSIAVVLLAAAPAADGYLVGTGEAPAGDGADPAGARDLLGVGLGYDPRTGELRAAVALREPATDETNALLTVFAGRTTPTGCDGYPAIGFSTDTSDFAARWLRVDAPGVPSAASGSATKTRSAGTVQEFAADDGVLRGLTLDCAIAVLSEPGNPQVVYDHFVVALAPKPLLTARLAQPPALRSGGRTRTVRLRIANPGSAPTGPIALRAQRPRGVGARAPRRLAPLAAGAARTVRVRLTAGRRARAGQLRLTARAGGLRAVVARGVSVVTPSLSDGGRGGRPPGPSTCTRWSPDPFGGSGGSLILVPCTR